MSFWGVNKAIWGLWHQLARVGGLPSTAPESQIGLMYWGEEAEEWFFFPTCKTYSRHVPIKKEVSLVCWKELWHSGKWLLFKNLLKVLALQRIHWDSLENKLLELSCLAFYFCHIPVCYRNFSTSYIFITNKLLAIFINTMLFVITWRTTCKKNKAIHN